MNWFRRMLEQWRTKGQGRVRRVIVLVLEGLEPARVDEYLEQGLLHHLALLSDIGTRANWLDSAEFVDGRSLGGRCVELRPPLGQPPIDLAAICDADRAQQERLFATLAHTRRGVILGVFDMPAQVRRLYGPSPAHRERQVIRDVDARMDEIVGKAFSFVDDRSVLLAAIPSPTLIEAANDSAAHGLIFASCRTDEVGPRGDALQATVLRLLDVAPRDA